jgi:hypothetical protein
MKSQKDCQEFYAALIESGCIVDNRFVVRGQSWPFQLVLQPLEGLPVVEIKLPENFLTPVESKPVRVAAAVAAAVAVVPVVARPAKKQKKGGGSSKKKKSNGSSGSLAASTKRRREEEEEEAARQMDLCVCPDPTPANAIRAKSLDGDEVQYYFFFSLSLFSHF